MAVTADVSYVSIVADVSYVLPTTTIIIGGDGSIPIVDGLINTYVSEDYFAGDYVATEVQ